MGLESFLSRLRDCHPLHRAVPKQLYTARDNLFFSAYPDRILHVAIGAQQSPHHINHFCRRVTRHVRTQHNILE